MHDDLEKIIASLPELWADYSANKIQPKNHPFVVAIAEIAKANKLSEWNDTIDWLDANFPDWRGYSAPAVNSDRRAS
jgi:hypothetical protein